MIYPANFEQKIGFDRIREQVADLCTTTLGRGKAAAAVFLTDAGELEVLLSQTQEMRTILLIEEGFPDTNYVDAAEFLKKLHIEGSYIEVPELVILKIALETATAIVNFFKHCNEELYPCLRATASKIVIYPTVSQRIDLIINKHGMVRDNASPELQQLRRAIQEKQTQVARRMVAILKSAQSEGIVDADVDIVLREGRSVIPVLAVNKRKIKGLVYDESATGKTLFIEPMEVVEMNNEIREMQYAEQREIIRILKAFTDFLRPYLEEVKATADFLGEMDFIRAKARLATTMAASKPVLRTTPFISLFYARHPLLEQALKKENKPIVPLSLRLDNDKHILLISGPNAGGKSVCLKTVGLLQYMFQCGFLIPASDDSELGIFHDIFIDIGDEQSIDNDLSTYSSHLLNMKHFLCSATAGSLVLIDEFGAGTEPAAGGAIAEAVLTQLTERHTFGVITTHYTNLKYYATAASGIVNGAMLFDVQQIQPLFRLETGTPGSSFAFELARKIGLSEPLLKRAESHAGSGFVDLEKNLKGIARNRRNLEEKLARIKQTDKTLEKITDKYQTELEEISRMRKSIIAEAKEEAKRIVNNANRQVEHTIREIKESLAEKERTKVAREQLTQVVEELEQGIDAETDLKIAQKMEQIRKRKERRAEKAAQRNQAAPPLPPASAPVHKTPLAVGDKVRVKGGDIIGEVLQLTGTKASISMGQMVTTLSLDKLERLSQNEYRALQPPAPVRSAPQTFELSERRLHFKPSIDIRGQRLDEALETVSHFIDDAIMVSAGEVSILHGKGNGVLREEIRKFLRTIGGVVSFADEHVEYGGAGITIVKLI